MHPGSSSISWRGALRAALLACALLACLAQGASAARPHGASGPEPQRASPAPRALRAEVDRRRAREAAATLSWRDGHASARVRTLAFAPDASSALTSDEEGYVVVWDALGARARAWLGPLASTADAPLAASLSPDGARALLVEPAAGRAWVADLREGRLVRSFGTDELLVRCGALDAAGERAVLGCADGSVLLVDARLEGSPAPLARTRAAGMDWSEAAFAGPAPALRSSAGLVCLYALDEGRRLVRRATPATAERPAVAWAVEVASGLVACALADGALVVLDAREPEPRARALPAWSASAGVADRASEPPRLALAQGLVLVGTRGGSACHALDGERPALALEGLALALAEDGRRALVERGDALELVETRGGELVVRLEGVRAPLADVVLDARGALIGALETRGRALVWPLVEGRAGASAPRVLAGRTRGSWPGAPSVARRGEETLVLALPRPAPGEAEPGARGTTGESAHSTPLVLWSSATGTPRLVQHPPAEERFERACLAAAEGELLVVTLARSRTGEARLLVARAGEAREASDDSALALAEPRSLALEGFDPRDALASLACSEDGRRACVATRRSGLWLVALDPEEAPRVLLRAAAAGPFDGEGPPALALGPQGRTLAFVGATGGERASPEELFVWVEGRDREPRRLEGAGAPRRLALSPRAGASQLVVGAYASGTLAVWEATSGARLLALEEPAPLVALALTPDGRGVLGLDARMSLRLRALADGRLFSERRLLAERPVHEEGALEPGFADELVLAPDGSRALVLERSGRATLVALRAREEPRPLELVAGVLGATFTADGRRLVLACADGAQHVLDAASARPLGLHLALAGGEWLALAPSGHFAASPRGAEPARLSRGIRPLPLRSWDAFLHAPARLAEALAGEPASRPFLPEPPRVRFLSPRPGLQPAGEGLALEARAEGAFALVSLELFLDGEPLPPALIQASTRRSEDGRGASLTLALELESARTTTLELYAQDERGTWSAPARLSLAAEPPTRELWVLAPPDADAERLIERLRQEAPGLFAAVHAQRAQAADDAEAARFVAEARPEDTLLVLAPDARALEAWLAGARAGALLATCGAGDAAPAHGSRSNESPGNEPPGNEPAGEDVAAAAGVREALAPRGAGDAGLRAIRVLHARRGRPAFTRALLAALAPEAEPAAAAQEPAGRRASAPELDAEAVLERARLALEREGADVVLERAGASFPLARRPR